MSFLFKKLLLIKLTPIKNPYQPYRNKHQKGQAVVEYILILIVTLTLVIGLSTKFITPLGKFMKNYAGAYVECLLETGDLPYFITANPNSQCSIEKMEATGRLPASANVASTNSNTSSKTNSKTNTTQNNGNNTSGTNNLSNNSPRPRTGANTGADTNNTGGSGPNKGDKLAAAANAASGSNSLANSEFNGNNRPQDYGSGITGVVKIPRKKGSNEDEDDSQKSIKKDKTAGGENLRKSSFSAPISKKIDQGYGPNLEMDLGFQFGKYLRYLLIAMILLAIILMVGNQLNSLRKGWTGGD